MEEIDYPNDASRTIEIFGDLELTNQEAIVRVANPDNLTQNVGQLIVHGKYHTRCRQWRWTTIIDFTQ